MIIKIVGALLTLLGIASLLGVFVHFNGTIGLGDYFARSHDMDEFQNRRVRDIHIFAAILAFIMFVAGAVVLSLSG